MADRAAYLFAIWFGCGLVPRMPGTIGTLGALPVYFLVVPAGPVALAAVAGALAVVGVWAGGRVARCKNASDPQIVCIDEVAGVLTTLVAAPVTARGIVAGVVLFRFFDHLKPWPARWAESLPGGWGIVIDDLVAALWGAALLGAARAAGWL